MPLRSSRDVNRRKFAPMNGEVGDKGHSTFLGNRVSIKDSIVRFGIVELNGPTILRNFSLKPNHER